LPERFDLSYQTAEDATTAAAAPTPDAEGGPRQGHVRPVIIHRAIYGSFERFIGILTEHFGGKWPFWLSPRQIMIVPVMASAYDYVKEVQTLLRTHEFHADVDLSANTLNKKIRSAQLLQYNFILGEQRRFLIACSDSRETNISFLVLGAKEMTDRVVTIRSRDSAEKTQSAEQVVLPLDEAIVKFKALRESQSLLNKLE
jgi:threonyl-tRNA synthetase